MLSGDSNAYLLFSLSGARYAIRVDRVFEILWLPELSPVAQAPYDVAGIFNLRGRIVTVLDLNLRLGYRLAPYRTEDRVIVISGGDELTGIIVNDVSEVRELDAAEVSDAPNYGFAESQRASLYISRIARLGGELVTVLDEDLLLKSSEGLHEKILALNAQMIEERDDFEKLPANYRELPVFCPDATDAERRVFRERAASLARDADEDEETEVLHLAVVALNQERFAVELDGVVEFTDVRQPTPVPCAPNHVVGCMNLRGEILTLLDIRGMLQLSMSARHRGGKVVVAKAGSVPVGVVVDEVLDVLPLRLSELDEAPSAVRSSALDYVRGACRYDDGTATVLNLSRILEAPELVVDEEV